MKANAVVAGILLATLLTIGAWDIYASGYMSEEDTVTAIVRAWSTRYPILPFIAGLLAGHLFGW